MTASSPLPDQYLPFFRSLFSKTSGHIQKQVSMHEIGNETGLDKTASKSVSEELMRLGLIDIRTLSGGIGLTEEGLIEARSLFADIAGTSSAITKLGKDPIIGEKIALAVADTINHLKILAGKLGLAYNDLTELVSDIQTIDAQMRSSRPKTAIVRECFRSIQTSLGRTDETDMQNRIKSFLAE